MRRTHTLTRRPLRTAALAGALALVVAACGGSDEPAADGPTIVTRGQDFSEARTIAQVYAQHLEALGYGGASDGR